MKTLKLLGMFLLGIFVPILATLRWSVEWRVLRFAEIFTDEYFDWDREVRKILEEIIY